MEVPPNNADCPQCKQLLKIIEQLQEQNKRLEQRLEAVEREGKRQAAPFRKKRKPLPRKSGRKKGDDYGKHQRRAAPATIDETYDVPLPEVCPDCGETKLAETEPVVQYQPTSLEQSSTVSSTSPRAFVVVVAVAFKDDMSCKHPMRREPLRLSSDRISTP